jgi:hypothetical protein
VAAVKHSGGGVLRGGAERGPRPVWQAWHLQYRSRRAIHQRRVYQGAAGSRDRDQHRRTRALPRNHGGSRSAVRRGSAGKRSLSRSIVSDTPHNPARCMGRIFPLGVLGNGKPRSLWGLDAVETAGHLLEGRRRVAFPGVEAHLSRRRLCNQAPSCGRLRCPRRQAVIADQLAQEARQIGERSKRSRPQCRVRCWRKFSRCYERHLLGMEAPGRITKSRRERYASSNNNSAFSALEQHPRFRRASCPHMERNLWLPNTPYGTILAPQRPGFGGCR